METFIFSLAERILINLMLCILWKYLLFYCTQLYILSGIIFYLLDSIPENATCICFCFTIHFDNILAIVCIHVMSIYSQAFKVCMNSYSTFISPFLYHFIRKSISTNVPECSILCRFHGKKSMYLFDKICKYNYYRNQKLT